MSDANQILSNHHFEKFRRCVIHIGTEKTGTSSIQKFLADSRESLRADGVVYPKCAGLRGGSQWEFVAYAHSRPWAMDFGKRLRITAEGAHDIFRKSFFEELLEEFNAVVNKDLLIISSEHFHSCLGEVVEIERLKILLEPWCSEIRILMYLRRQDRLAVSYYSTKLKGGDANPVLFPNLKAVEALRYFDYLDLYKKWALVFGSANIDVRLFESAELIGGDLLLDFCSSIGIEPRGAASVPRLNPSLSRDGLDFALALNRQLAKTKGPAAEKQHTEIIEFISREYSGHGDVTGRDEAIDFVERFSTSNDLLRRVAFPQRVEPLFDSDFSSYPETFKHVVPENLDALMAAIKKWRQLREDFDEVGYRKAYPDVARAIESGRLSSAWQHYQSHGRQEGRKPKGFAGQLDLKKNETDAVQNLPVVPVNKLAQTDSKSFIFCTSYIKGAHGLKNRYKKWYNHYRKLSNQPIVIIDDNSPFSLKNTNWMNFDGSKIDGSLANFHTFDTHLGRKSIHDFPGWFRSFVYSIEIARKYEYNRIIHIESDLIILKRSMLDELCEIDSGWNVVWCPKYNMPETAVQVICEDQFDSVINAYQEYQKIDKNARAIETILPFTNVIKRFNGDRYGGDNRQIEDFMDFYAQFPVDMEIS